MTDSDNLNEIFDPVSMDELEIPKWWVDSVKAKINSIYISRAEVREAIGEMENIYNEEMSFYENEPVDHYAENRNQLRSELLKQLGLE